MVTKGLVEALPLFAVEVVWIDDSGREVDRETCKAHYTERKAKTAKGGLSGRLMDRLRGDGGDELRQRHYGASGFRMDIVEYSVPTREIVSENGLRYWLKDGARVEIGR